MNRLSTSYHKLIRAHNLLDIWNIKNLPHGQYTFYSPLHKLYSRLHYFFVTSPLLTSMVSLEINPITWSDHSSVHLDIALTSASPRACYWHLNESPLHVPEIRDHLCRDKSSFSLMRTRCRTKRMGLPPTALIPCLKSLGNFTMVCITV